MKKRGISLLSILIIIIALITIIIIVTKKLNTGTTTSIFNEDNNTTTKQKFSISMLNDNGLGVNTTYEDLQDKFGTLTNESSYVEGSTGDNIDIYVGNNVKAILRNSKLETCIITREDFEFNGIKIGDSKDKLTNAFYKEDTNAEVISPKDGSVEGTYLYGNYTIDNLDAEQEKDKVEYAYIESQSANSQYDYIVRYVYMEPPYIGDYATIYDNVACIEFAIKDDIITAFASQYAPGAE